MNSVYQEEFHTSYIPFIADQQTTTKDDRNDDIYDDLICPMYTREPDGYQQPNEMEIDYRDDNDRSYLKKNIKPLILNHGCCIIL
jgi:hypothetical protein